MSKFYVELERVVSDSYDIEIGYNLFDVLIRDLKNGLIKNVSKFAIITDSNVSEWYGNDLLKCMKNSDFDVTMFVFEANEENKTRDTKANLEDCMIKSGFGRDSCIIALGGGVVTDLAGFLAGTYARGIPFINYATTLLAASDASVGGKTAVDTPAATNLIGVFKQPNKVYIDIETYKTLPIREIRSGLAETIKHACIADKSFFEYLEKNIIKVIDENGQAVLDKEVCEYIAYKNCEIKYNVIKLDDKEINLRQILNLGHTIGRAIETLSEYKLLHGEAISIGIVAQIIIAKKFNFVTDEEVDRVISLLKSVDLPIAIPEYIATQELVNKLYTDKKVRMNQIRFVFQSGIGNVKRFNDGSFSKPLSENFLLEIIDEIKGKGL